MLLPSNSSRRLLSPARPFAGALDHPVATQRAQHEELVQVPLATTPYPFDPEVSVATPAQTMLPQGLLLEGVAGAGTVAHPPGLLCQVPLSPLPDQLPDTLPLESIEPLAVPETSSSGSDQSSETSLPEALPPSVPDAPPEKAPVTPPVWLTTKFQLPLAEPE
jgi:hypothetical protein